MLDKEFERCSDPIRTAKNVIGAIKNPVFPLDVESLALAVGIQGIQEISDENVEGILLALPDKSAGFINISKHIRENTRKRFTIAHELGHFLITTHQNKYSCNPEDIGNYNKKYKPEEAEANKFAAELLMPESKFLAEIQYDEPSYNLFQGLTRKFETSLQSTLIRFKELTSESIAIVLSENSTISWVTKSGSFGHYIENRVPLSKESVAIEFFEGQVALPQEFEEVDKNTWFDASDIEHKLIVKELSIPLPYYQKVLSVIWLFEDEEDIEEYDDYEDEFDGYLKLKNKW